MSDVAPLPDGLTSRAMSGSDVDAVAALMAAAEAVDRTEEHYDAEDLREELADERLDPARDWVLVHASDGILVAHQRLRPFAPDGRSQKLGLDGVVHPDHRGRGIGTALVHRLHRRALEHVAERDAGLRAVLVATTPADLEDAAGLLEGLGMVGERWTFVMEAALTGDLPPAPALPEGYRLETWEGIDHEEVRTVHTEVFRDHPGSSAWDAAMWQLYVSGARSLRPALSFVLRDADGSVASYLQTAEHEAVEAATGRREAYVAKVGTRRAHRRRGLGAALLGLALRRYVEEGYVAATLDVDSENPTGANAVYERAGFVVTRRWTNYRLEA